MKVTDKQQKHIEKIIEKYIIEWEADYSDDFHYKKMSRKIASYLNRSNKRKKKSK